VSTRPSTYIFLCGASKSDSIRNALRSELESLRINVLYPEDLFMDMIEIDKDNDLFSFENLLANQSNAICVICESMGSAAELGAFVQNDSIRNKLILCTDKKYKKDESFISRGPLRYHRKTKGCVLYFDRSKLKEFAKKTVIAIDQIKKASTVTNKKEASLVSLINLLPITLWFCETLNRKILFDVLKSIYQNETSEFQVLFNASINYLLKHRMIEVDYGNEKYNDQLKLSSSGILAVERRLFKPPNRIDKIKLIDQRRCDMMNLSLYGKYPLS
jgi:hypothetical protein